MPIEQAIGQALTVFLQGGAPAPVCPTRRATPDPAQVQAQAERAIARLTGGGGRIRWEARQHVLANLAAYFWLDGFKLPAGTRSARLPGGGGAVTLDLRLDGIEWDFDERGRAGRVWYDGLEGLGRPYWPTHEGPDGQLSPVQATFRQAGRHEVRVTCFWTVTANFNGRALAPVQVTSGPPPVQLVVEELRIRLTG